MPGRFRFPVRRLRAAPVLAALALLAAVTSCGPAAPDSGVPDSSARTPFDSALYDRLPVSVRDQGRIRMATTASYAPASFFDRDGRTIIGFEPDLAAALGRVLGVELAFVRLDFRQVLPALEAGEVDLIMAAMTDTPQLQQRVDFIDYFAAGTSILVQRGNPYGIRKLADLCGRTVAAEAGTSQVEILDRAQSSCGERRILVRQFPDNNGALVELRTGRAAAVLNDYPPAVRLTTDVRTRTAFELASPMQYEPGLYGIAVRKDQGRLRDALREALNRLVRSGEYAQILREWRVASGAVERASLNAGT